MKIHPLIVGRGRSAMAVIKCLAILKTMEPPWELATPVLLERGQSLADIPATSGATRLLFVCGPHALHGRSILDAEKAGISLVVSEKPVCTNPQDASALEKVKIPVAVLHVYRQMWGPRKLRQMIEEGRFGKIFALEGRYWQSSAAQAAQAAHVELPQSAPGGTGPGAKPETWKDDPRLSGPHDVLLDLGTHWIDMVQYLSGETPRESKGFLHYANSASPHRDTHAQVNLLMKSGARALGSISKTVHGAGNHFEIHVLGDKASATWAFECPDQIIIGEGKEKRTLTRAEHNLGSGQDPFHGMGWLEGYLEIIKQSLHHAAGLPHTSYPSLRDSLEVMKTVFSIADSLPGHP